MSITQKIIALAFSIIFIFIAYLIFSYKLINVSLPDEFTKIQSNSIIDSIRIYRNTYKIPHIIAGNEYDLFFSIGYVHAQDRLWQMDIMRRIGSGRLSELFGEETLFLDKFMRAIGFEEIAEKIWDSCNKKTSQILQAYSDGINAFINTHKYNLQFEFGALDYLPEQWKPTDCLVIGRLMAFEMSMSFIGDVVFGEIADKLGFESAIELIPDYPEDGPFVVDDSTETHKTKKQSDKTFAEIFKDEIDIFSRTSDLLSKVRKYLWNEASSCGSNSWAIKKNKSNPSGAVLANDPHLASGLPPKWYQIHITSFDYNAIGLTLPGNPLVIIGRNDYISWGITNMMLDDCDFFIEKVDSSDNDYYFTSETTKKKFIYVKDTIKVRGKEDEIYYIRNTYRSAVISDFHLFRNPQKVLDMEIENFKNQFLDRYCLTYQWTGKEPSDETFALYTINKAKYWGDFLVGLKFWKKPGQNFTYADKYGNIGIAPTGAIPGRRAKCNPNIPNPGWLNDYNWTENTDSIKLTNLYNPNKNFVFSANDKMSGKFNGYISTYWEPSSRAERIEKLLSDNIEYSSRDAQLMQMDYLSPYAKELTKILLQVIEKASTQLSGMETEAYKILKNWDYIMSPGYSAPSIYNSFFERLIFNTFHDELGERIYRQYLLISNVPTRKILELLKKSDSRWFDNINTPYKENKEYILFKSFRDAVVSLKDIFDTDEIQNWDWGKLHTITLKHIFSENTFLKPTVTIGPFPIGGNHTTINNSEWKIYKPFEMHIGVSARFIADMTEDIIYTIVPGGSSGDPLNPNYADQVQLWLNGGYVEMRISREPTTEEKLAILIVPKE